MLIAAIFIVVDNFTNIFAFFVFFDVVVQLYSKHLISQGKVTRGQSNLAKAVPKLNRNVPLLYNGRNLSPLSSPLP